MPLGRIKMRMDWQNVTRRLVGFAAMSLLAGCFDQPSMLRSTAGAPHVMAATPSNASPIIASLQQRKSILPPSGPYGQLGAAILAANSGAAAAELRMAQLKAEAKSKNWLPQLGPSISLSSLSGMVASLTLSQPLIDNGRRRAERDFASADVEVAAVALSATMNQRVYEGLQYYVQSQRAVAQAAVSSAALTKLSGFEAAMQTRVEGGISDMSEKNVISQRAAEMRATVAADQDNANTALGQLSAMIGRPVTGLSGLDDLPQILGGPVALSVLRKQGEGKRALAGAAMSRADMLPGLTASVEGTDAGVNKGVRLTGLGLLNPGASATMQAIAQTAQVVDAQNADAADAANRRMITLSGEINTLSGRAVQGARVLAQTESNLELFTEQYKVGRSTLLDLVGQYDAYARLKRDQVSLRYEIVLRQLEMARDTGLLVDGSQL
jgi:adhesin transport system outer membrane protein